MTATRSARGVLWFACLGAAALAPGCSKSMHVMVYPDFYTPDLKTLAVVQFGNDSGEAKAGEIFTDTLAAAFKANGAYRVLGPGQLKAVLEKAKIELKPDADRQTVLTALARLGGVQAVLIGRIGQYAVGRSVHQRVYSSYPYYGHYGDHGYYGGYRGYGRYGRYYGRHGRYYYPRQAPYWHVYDEERNEASVSAMAALWRVDDGSGLHSLAMPARATVISQGSPPPLAAGGCLARAGRHVAGQIVEEFAPTPLRIKIKPKRALKTATGRTGAAWNFEDDFKADDEKMFVVVALPETCHRNTFRLEIAREGVEEALATARFTWSRQDRNAGFPFSPRDLAQQGGAGTFEVRFFTPQKLVMSRKFKIEK